MSFLYPSFLFALSAIAIPIIIHLFNFRKFKTIYFSNVRFLKEVKEETKAKSKLKHLLVLLARILAITSIVFAFSQPFIPSENQKVIVGDKVVSIFIDNSFSMDAINKNGTLLDDAKKKAKEICQTYKASDRFQILTNDFEGKHQRLVNKDEFSELLEEIKISPNTKSISEIISRQTNILNQSGIKNKTSYILSDFQKSIVDLNKVVEDTTVHTNLIPIISSEKNNVYIDTCWFESPVRQLNQIEQLHVLIKNKSEKEIENNSVKLFINNEQKTPASFNIDKNSDTEVILSFNSKDIGFQNCRIEINDYPISFDDKFYFSFDVTNKISILNINSTSSTEENYLAKLFHQDSLFDFNIVEENKIDYSAFNNSNIIILSNLKSLSSGLSQELKKYLINGGNILIFPSENIDFDSYNQFLISVQSNTFIEVDSIDSKIDNINFESDIYKNVFDKKQFSIKNIDLPKVFEHYKLSANIKNNGEYLLKLQNGDVLLSKSEINKGKIYISAIGLNSAFSNFPKHALFVPTLYKIGINSLKNNPLFYTIGENQSISTLTNNNVGETVFYIKDINNEFEYIPEHKNYNSNSEIFVNNNIQKANNYILYSNNNKLHPLSFNYNRKESDLTCFTNEALENEVEQSNLNNFKIIASSNKQLNEIIAEQEQGKKLWKFCVILALLFLGVEIALLRLMKS